MSEIVNVPMKEQRDIRTVTAEIRTLQNQAQRMILEYAIEIGRRLTEAKTMVEHGQWGAYIKEELGYSQSTANNFMAIYNAYGEDQTCLFGAQAKSQTFGNLTYSKALKLLAVPEEEREAFVEENHVEDLSTRELDRLIRERAEEAQARQTAEGMAREAEQERDHWKKEAGSREEQIKDLTAKGLELTQALEKAREQEKTARDKLEELRKNPEIPKEAVDKLRQEAEKKAAEQLKTQLEQAAEQNKAALREAVEAKEEAEKAAQRATEELQAAKKKLSTADPDVTAFKVCFDGLQTEANRLKGYLKKIELRDSDTAGKLRGALAALAESLKQA